MKDSNIDYYQGFKYCLENALNHLKVAELSTEVSYGIAHAHVVLASEEAVKTMMLFNIHYDKDVLDKIDDFDAYFSNHKHKHDTIMNLEHFSILFQKMLMILWAPFVGIKPNSISLDEVKQKIREGKKNLMQWTTELSDAKNEQTTLETNNQWWKQAESFKKNGFYVDLLKKRGDWYGPYKCSKRQYDKGRKIALGFIEKVQQMEEYMADPDVAELYRDFKTNN